MKLDTTAIQNMERIYRLNLINSITGIKPANLVGTVSDTGNTNLAIFSSVIHLGSDPALIGFVTRPAGEVPRHTYENILANGKYTINHVHPSFAEQAHQTSAKFPRDVSEFDACGLTEEFVDGFEAPFVLESSLKLGLELVEEIPVKQNGTTLIIGRIAIAIVPDKALDSEGHLDLEKADSAGISGLNSYYSVKTIGQYPYARVAKSTFTSVERETSLPRFDDDELEELITEGERDVANNNTLTHDEVKRRLNFPG